MNSRYVDTLKGNIADKKIEHSPTKNYAIVLFRTIVILMVNNGTSVLETENK